jgi:hypothetical protein
MLTEQEQQELMVLIHAIMAWKHGHDDSFPIMNDAINNLDDSTVAKLISLINMRTARIVE